MLPAPFYEGLMVETRVDVARVPTLSLNMEELDGLQSMIDKGELPPDFIERHFDAVDANVFGVDAPKDKNGQRLEQGLGSSRNQTRQSIDAYKRWHKGEPNFDENVKKMEAQLASKEQNSPTDIRELWRRRRGAAR